VLDAGGSIASTLRTKTDPQKEERLPPAGLDGKERCWVIGTPKSNLQFR